MPVFNIITSILGISIAFLIFHLLRRDKLYANHSLLWMAIALLVVIFGLYPRLADIICGYLDVNYAPILIVVVALLIIFLMLLNLDLSISRIERNNRELIQRMALLEHELNKLKSNIQDEEKDASHTPS